MHPLKTFLEQLYTRYHASEYLGSDPLEFVHKYQDPWDREAVALIAALLAYGNVTQIRNSVADALGRMEKKSESPADFVRVRAGKGDLQGWIHRFNTGRDLDELLRLLGESWKRHGSLGAHFISHLPPDSPTIETALNGLIGDWLKWSRLPADASFAYFLTPPSRGSCCKRWCMFLRWMGRKDGMDPGLWARDGEMSPTFPAGRWLDSRQLIMPLDTHTGRLSQYLGLTSRKSLGWKAAREITAEIGKFAPSDPTRYDFALARLGILDLCQKKYRPEICESCELLPVCHFARKRRVLISNEVNRK